MKRILSFSVLYLCILYIGQAQVSRSNTKKSVPYRANYQRMSSSGNSYHNFEIRNGTLWGWGRNLFGEIGDGTAGTQRNSPVQIGTDNKWVTVATGGMHTLALKADGTLWSWGYNGNGQLGNGTTTNKTTPTQVGTDTKWTCVVAGSQSSLALKADGTLWAWGYNNSGQVGDGTTVNKTAPVQIGTDTKWTSISAGNSHALALKADGTLWAWGANNANQVGDGTTTNRLAPVQIGVESKWTNISAGYQFNLALKADGTLWSWGYNANGQLGIGTTTSQSAPIQVGADNSWVTISAGEAFATALKANGTCWTWGTNANGQLGDGTTVGKSSPIQMGTDNKWVSVFAGAVHTLALKADGTLWTWGANASGQIGDGTTVQKTNPVQIKGAPDEWVSTSSFEYNNFGLKANGALWAWGNNDKGQLGDGTMLNRSTPVQIGSDTKWISIAAGKNHTLGLKADGTLWAWGTNSFGELGDGTTINRSTPVQIGTDTNWQGIYASWTFTFALKADGTLWACGSNNFGQLGLGNTINNNTLVQIGTDNTWVTAACGVGHTLGIKSNGTLWTWGQMNTNSVDNNLSPSSTIPVQRGTDNKWTSVSAEQYSSTGLQADGTIWQWGYLTPSYYNGAFTVNPTQTGTDHDWIRHARGVWSTSIGLKSNGSLWAWGGNEYGQFGNGTLQASATPLQIGAETTWVHIANGGRHTVGIKSDRAQYCTTGLNLHSQLGDGTTVDKSNFVCNTNACNPANNALNVSGPSAVCPSKNNNIFTVTNTSAGATYTWTVPTGATIVSGQGTAALTVNWGTSAGSVTVFETNGCGTASGAAVSFSVALLPVSNNTLVLGGPAAVCPSSAGNVFSVTNPVAGATFTWSVPAGASITSGQGTSSITVAWGTTAGTLSVAETTCGTGTAFTKAVALSPTPNNALALSGPTSVCSLANYTFTITNSTAGATYNWSVPSGCSIVSGQGTSSINVAWGTVNGSVSVSETTVCGTGTAVSKAAVVSPTTYALGSVDAFCASTFAVPLKTTGAISNGIIGLDFAINYNTAVMTPTGAAYTGTVATAYGGYSMNTSTPGKVYISVFLNNAPNGTYFSGNGDVAYVYFQVNAGVAAGTAFTLSTDNIEESTPVNTNSKCPAVTLNSTVKNAVAGTLIYRNTPAATLKYDPANPAAYVASSVTGTNAACVQTSTGVSRADLSGVFKFSPGNGANIIIQRDINGDLNTPALNCTNIQSVINSMDRIQAADIATYKTTNVPIYTLLSADVNLDGKITAGDVSLISSRSINNNNCEFPQNNYTWNGTALVPAANYVKSQDWLFVDDATLASAAFTTGTGRNNVPKVPACLPAPTGTASCSPASTATYHAILLGDVDGSWISTNGAQLRTAAADDAIIVDLSQADKNISGNYVVPVFCQTAGAFYGMDFSLDYAADISVQQVKANTTLANVGTEFNTIAQQRVMVTSYTQDSIYTTLPVAYMEIAASAALTPNSFSNAQAYLNGKPADLKFTFDGAPEKNTAYAEVYPNPFRTEFFIYAADTEPFVQVSIFNLSGAAVYENDKVPANEAFRLDQLQEAGVYLVRITCSNGTVTKKLIKF